MSEFLPDERATIELAGRFAAALPDSLAGWTVLLAGELGAGKSTFARALIRTLGHSGPVPSPTYTLVEPYQVPRGPIYHIDLYRVTSDDELRYLGWNEIDDGLRLVEWPERAPGLAEQADLQLTLAYDGAGRTARFLALSEKGRQLMAALAVDNT
jgi:tRNA threonylcarbamoyladenosine biosynthesis protein TsaE